MSDYKGPRVVQIPDIAKMGEFAGQWAVYDGDNMIAGYHMGPISEEMAREIVRGLDLARGTQATTDAELRAENESLREALRAVRPALDGIERCVKNLYEAACLQDMWIAVGATRGD